ncbi:cytochrome P450 6B1-like [Phymastichus coffea]|uniref:cytochrome P450 6B1-like n=1 Tax=Phymastichus coffea TaxID=108790 RepID=UPI00273B0538|nr:cytochrome P450 6B1-like [Phymastichus coffea]
MELGIFELLISIGIIFLGLYYYTYSKFDYWIKRKIEGPKPIPFFGNFKDVILGKKHDAMLIQEFYEQFKNEPLVGIYSLSSPKLIVKDLDLIKDVLIKDFNVFADRGIKIHEKVEPFSLHIFNLEYKRWKPVRAKLTPIFTSGKLRDMFYLIADCGTHFQNYVERLAEKSDAVDCRELTAKFTTDSIGVCAFGLNMNSIAEEDSEFRKFGRSLFEPSFRNKAKRLLRQFAPAIYDVIGRYMQPAADKFFEKCVKETMTFRKDNNVRRNDFLDLLIDLKNNPEKIQTFELTDQLLISQAFVFFAAGFETSSTTMANALHELALNQDIQDKLRKEINEELEKCNGKLTYDSVKNMRYLDQIIKETLRKYPPVTMLVRKTLTSYTFNDTKCTIPKNMSVFIPIWSIHRDPEIYRNPEVYDPERFSEENEKSRHPMTFLPFGDGPHNCIGSRFANYQSKVGIISVIQKYKVEICDKTCKDYRLIPQAIIAMPKGGLHVKLTKV